MNRKIAWIFLTIVGIVAIIIFSCCLFAEVKAKMLYQEGQELQQKGEYENAIAKYNLILTDYAGSDYAFKARNAIAECMYEWGLDLEQKGEYGDAIAKYETVVISYFNSTSVSKTGEALEKCYKKYDLEVANGGEAVHEDEYVHVRIQRVDGSSVIFLCDKNSDRPLLSQGETSETIKINGDKKIKAKVVVTKSFERDFTLIRITNGKGGLIGKAEIFSSGIDEGKISSLCQEITTATYGRRPINFDNIDLEVNYKIFQPLRGEGCYLVSYKSGERRIQKIESPETRLLEGLKILDDIIRELREIQQTGE